MKKTLFTKIYRPTTTGLLLLASDILVKLLFIFITLGAKNAPLRVFRNLYKSRYIIEAYIDLIAISLVFLLGVVWFFEIMDRKLNDDLRNTIISIKETALFHGFLKNYPASNASTGKMSGVSNSDRIVAQFNHAIKKSMIDVRCSKVHVLIKLPRAQQAQLMFKDREAQIREYLSSQMPEYFFSNATREKNTLRIEGTKNVSNKFD